MTQPFCYCTGAMAAEIALTIMTNQTPHWSNIAILEGDHQ
jgi:hypothetical protein